MSYPSLKPMLYLAALRAVGVQGAAPASALPQAPGPVLYVSPAGSDQWSGRLAAANDTATDGPFLTIPRALDAVRDARAAPGPAQPVTVLIRAGVYSLSRPLNITPAHSGSPGCPTVIAAFPGERPLLSGGRRISGWRAAANDLWEVDLPGGSAGRWFFRQLWVNGKRRQRPRLPREGSYRIEAGVKPEKSAFRFAPGHLRADWSNPDDIEVVVLQYWMAARLRLAQVDEAARAVTFTGGSWRPLTWSMGYFVENVAEAGCAPGEWYLDRAAGLLRYRPMPGEDMTNAEAGAPVAAELLRLSGEVDRGAWVQHVVVRGLGFAHCAWPLPAAGLGYPQADLPVGAAITGQGMRACAIDDCEIAHCDSWGIALGRGCQDNRLRRNALHDLGAGGIRIGEPVCPAKEAHDAGRTLIAENTLADGAQTYFSGCGIWLGHSGQNTVSHNEISGSWQFAISSGWRWGYFPPQGARDNVIEYNHIHHIGTRWVGSHSSIYTLGIQPGTVIRHNVIHHGAGFAIAFDQAGTGMLAENNLIYRNARGLHFNYHCLGNIVQNNIFAFNGETQWTRYGDAPPPGEDATLNVLQR